MKTKHIILTAVSLILIGACSSSKKSKASANPTVPSATASTPTATSTNTFTSPFSMTRSIDGIYAPGNEELLAIQAQYKDVTLQKLNEGYTLYVSGACVNCHGAQNIYRYSESQWKAIIIDMAQRARLTEEQKDAVYKYVLAQKATQP